MEKPATALTALFALLQLFFVAGPAFGQGAGQEARQQTGQAYGNVRTVKTISWIEEWDPATARWVKVESDETAAEPAPEARSAARYAQPVAPRDHGAMLAQYGPFVVTSPVSAAMMGSTDSASPAQFDAMLRDFPQLATLQLVEAPGTSNDLANLAVGRRIREAGIDTHVPNGGSVRSGAVELFLAGATRTIEQGAQFAVHSWLDNHGREADDFSADHPANRLYIDYYVEMGMSESRARDFYAMTNSVPHSSALWLGAGDMHPWLQSDRMPAFRMAAVRTEAFIGAGPITLDAVVPAKVLYQMPDVHRAAVPAFIAPELNFLDLSTITLAQLNLVIVS